MTRTRYKFLPQDHYPYFITSTTVNWLPLFKEPDIAEIIFNSLKFMIREERLIIYAYVLMENHIHLIASAENLSQEIARFKSFTARQSIDYYKEKKIVQFLISLHFINHIIEEIGLTNFGRRAYTQNASKLLKRCTRRSNISI